ncbi:hypothetical protein E2C01_020871 [Portunus trituberculatus]|uniref:Uncharacterized protein n=1 Tax=Portunus trituberculatus TaxID=210409 RepID=A0A5B7E122_PORTR|nr:hypothetical protein [Portunus trituberculatus]
MAVCLCVPSYTRCLSEEEEEEEEEEEKDRRYPGELEERWESQRGGVRERHLKGAVMVVVVAVVVVYTEALYLYPRRSCGDDSLVLLLPPMMVVVTFPSLFELTEARSMRNIMQSYTIIEIIIVDIMRPAVVHPCSSGGRRSSFITSWNQYQISHCTLCVTGMPHTALLLHSPPDEAVAASYIPPFWCCTQNLGSK